MANSSIDPSLRHQGDNDAPPRRSPKQQPPMSLDQNGPYPHRPTSAGMTDLAQQLANAVEHGVEHAHPPPGDYAPVHHTPMGPPATQYAHYGQELLGQRAMQASPSEDPDNKKFKMKTTRACDECRRKKIKCDGESDTPGDRCGNCMRTNAECLYTKPAQKRGPSRGYIRELSDRVMSLEQSQGMSPRTPQHASPFFTPDTAEMRGSKRTHSMSEHASTPTGAPYARAGGPADTVQVQFEITVPPVTKPLSEVERTQLNAWKSIAQTRFALLPDDIADAERLLNGCPDELRDVFVKCLRAAVSLPDSPDRALYREAYTAALGLMHQPKSASPLTNVVHLQVCVLLVFLSNTAGPSPGAGEPDGNVFLAKATTIAEHLKLRRSEPSDPSDQIEHLTRMYGRRAYGYLQLMYQWTSAAHGPSSSSGPESFRLRPTDGHGIPFDAFLLMCMVPDLELLRSHATRDEAVPPPSFRLDEYLEAVKLGLGMAGGKDPDDELLVSLTHSCMTIYRFLVFSKGFSTRVSPQIVKEATNVVAQFHAADLTFFPIAHQTLGLALLVLIEAVGDRATNSDARKALDDAKTMLSAGTTLHEDGWRAALLARVETRLKEKGANDTKEKDFGPWLKNGYMEFFE